MSILDDVKPFRRLLEYLAEGLDDVRAVTVPDFFPPWAVSKAYAVGDRVQHDSLLYKCLQAHTSQADWGPSGAPSLWARIDNPAEEWPLWRQPQGGHNPYPMGAKVSHNGEHWISEIANNVWIPGEYGWRKEQ